MISWDVYKTQSDLNAKSVYPSIIVLHFGSFRGRRVLIFCLGMVRICVLLWIPFCICMIVGLFSLLL